MQIGAFAELCGTKISVLRHYDKEGILIPAYIDPITGYRYYAAEQTEVFCRITALKQAGFSLGDIRRILSRTDSDEDILALFCEKEARLRAMLTDLACAREMMMDKTMQFQMTFLEEHGSTQVLSAYFDEAETDRKKQEMDGALRASRYQRISGYRVLRGDRNGTVRLSCDVRQLKQTPTEIHEDTELPFVDDALIIGRWEVVGEYMHRDDVPVCLADVKPEDGNDSGMTSLYFLPGGAWYWCYGWTRSKLLCRYGDSSYVCDYTTERVDGERYMFVDWKSYEYRYGGKPTVLVLRQRDTNVYTADALAKKDNVDLPFSDDPQVLGTWISIGMVPTPDAFDPAAAVRSDLFFSRVTFRAGGDVESVYGDRVIGGANMQVWTCGFILRKWNSTACAYEIRTINGCEYLFAEWKSGDYIWGGRAPIYYVFVRE